MSFLIRIYNVCVFVLNNIPICKKVALSKFIQRQKSPFQILRNGRVKMAEHLDIALSLSLP